MNFLARIIASKISALFILIGVYVWLLIVPVLTNELGANPVERLLHVSGEIAIWTLGAVLSLTPLRGPLPALDDRERTEPASPLCRRVGLYKRPKMSAPRRLASRFPG
jgi:hypothetical protein